MAHPIYRVLNVEVVGSYTLRMTFDDGTTQTIDFRPMLMGEVYGPLQDERLFNQVEVDPEVHTVVWPNGADFDPATLHDWPSHVEEFKRMAQQWARAGLKAKVV